MNAERNMTTPEDIDKYGSRLINCCFPDCGCDGARVCDAENGAHNGALVLNLEKRTPQDRRMQRVKP